MMTVRAATEDEMIAEFLKQEYASVERYRDTIDQCLVAEHLPAAIIQTPDLNSTTENADRLRLFARYRGYGQPANSYFTDFPAGRVDWSWCNITRDELLDTRFVRYWADIWESTRQPRDLAAHIRADRVPAWAVEQGAVPKLLALADVIARGDNLPPLILVTADNGATLVSMEGNARLTSYALAEQALIGPYLVLIGNNPEIARWDEW